MAITTYITDHDIKNWSEVMDPELNSLFQEARKKDPRLLIATFVREVKTGWFKKPLLRHYYSIRLNLGHEAQIINLPQDQTGSINTTYSRSYVMTYLYGFLNGMNRLQALQGKKEDANG